MPALITDRDWHLPILQEGIDPPECLAILYATTRKECMHAHILPLSPVGVLFCFVCLTTLSLASVGVRYHCGGFPETCTMGLRVTAEETHCCIAT